MAFRSAADGGEAATDAQAWAIAQRRPAFRSLTSNAGARLRRRTRQSVRSRCAAIARAPLLRGLHVLDGARPLAFRSAADGGEAATDAQAWAIAKRRPAFRSLTSKAGARLRRRTRQSVRSRCAAIARAPLLSGLHVLDGARPLAFRSAADDGEAATDASGWAIAQRRPAFRSLTSKAGARLRRRTRQSVRSRCAAIARAPLLSGLHVLDGARPLASPERGRRRRKPPRTPRPGRSRSDARPFGA